MAARRTGVLGGTFDPIHYGHLFIAEAVRSHAQLDRVLFVPVGEPAHRAVHASAAERTAMVELGIAGNAERLNQAATSMSSLSTQMAGSAEASAIFPRARLA